MRGRSLTMPLAYATTNNFCFGTSTAVAASTNWTKSLKQSLCSAMRGRPYLRSECTMHTSSKEPTRVESTMAAAAVCASPFLMADPAPVLMIRSLMAITLLAEPTPPTFPRPSASLGSLLARTTAASKSAGSVMGTTIVWTTAMKPLSSATSTPAQPSDLSAKTIVASPCDGCVMVTMTVETMRMNRTPPALLAHVHPTNTPVPVGAASPSPGHATLMMTVEIAQMNLIPVRIQPVSLLPSSPAPMAAASI